SGRICLGDFDGDGDLDLYTVHDFNPDQVWFNDGNANFVNSGQNLGVLNSVECEAGDFDGDGDLDVYVAREAVRGDKVWFNDGHGNFSPSLQSLGRFFAAKVRVGDLDGDEDLDVVVVDYDAGAVIWMNDGLGHFHFGETGTVSASQYYGGDLGDVDGDGDLDLILLDALGLNNHIRLNDGNGHFVHSGQLIGSDQNCDGRLTDFDGDGDLDLYMGAQNRPNQIWYNPGCADLRVVKTSSIASIGNTSAIPYSIVVENLGSVEATNVEVIDRLPAGTLFSSSLPLPDIQSGPTNIYQIGTLPPGQSALIQLIANVQTNAVGNLTNLAWATLLPADVNPANNEDKVILQIMNADNDALPDFIDNDDDNDNFSDEAESIAGTDPNDPNSFLSATITTGSKPDECLIQFNSATGRIYQIEACTDLLNNTWAPLISNISGDGGLQTITTSNPTQRTYYRLQVIKP
ncbi:MAG: DUF11 domain-containing protein, partial [Verrucomicrobiota bacterium]